MAAETQSSPHCGLSAGARAAGEGSQPLPLEGNASGSGVDYGNLWAEIAMKNTPERRDFPAELERRNWQLWMISFAVTASLTIGIAAFFLPAIQYHIDRIEIVYGILPQLIAGLVALVLLCLIYIVAKQRELNELRNYLIAVNLEARQLSEEYARDSLTGTFDRRALPEILKREVTWVNRYRIPLTLVLFNICGFHKINDAEGNLAGDLILKDLVSTLEATARETDTILRYAPDQFLCFLPRTDRKGAGRFGIRVLEACGRNTRLRHLSFQMGIAMYRPGGVPDDLLAEVEQHMAGSVPCPVASPPSVSAVV